MRAYFTQFGPISNLRLSRNKKTGASKHYAFIEFSSPEVARIVAATMDKYLLFGHILQVRYVPKEQVHADLWKGANRRFKPIPRAKVEGRDLRLGQEREGWERRITRESERRAQKAEKLKELGYVFDAKPLKSVDVVPKKEDRLAIAAVNGDTEKVEEQVKEIEAPAAEEISKLAITDVVVEKPTAKKSTKAKTSKVAAAKDTKEKK